MSRNNPVSCRNFDSQRHPTYISIYASRTGMGQMDWDRIALYPLSSLPLLPIIYTQ